jgi:TRAP-type mannitol/chloroaromatic compound transport system substrate-binding protein
MEDLKGVRIRPPGWHMDILTLLGVFVNPLPGSEICVASERGLVIDACEFSSPTDGIPACFREITKYLEDLSAKNPDVKKVLHSQGSVATRLFPIGRRPGERE